MPSYVPTATRPSFPSSYGISQTPDGMLEWGWVAERLERVRNYWLATTTASGAPHVRPVWALWISEQLCFSTDASGAKARGIARDPRVSVNLGDGEEVVILEGVAEPLPDGMVGLIADAYKRKYDWDVSVGDGWYAISAVRAYAWTEAGFANNATRFDF